MPSKTAKRALAIFFMVFGIGLAMFIIIQGINIFKDSRGYVDVTGTPSVDCIKYFYEIDRVSYSSGELAFTIRNLDYSVDISNITVVGASSQILPVSLPSGSSQQIRLAADLTSNFSIYPSGCSVYRLRCMLDTGTCSAG